MAKELFPTESKVTSPPSFWDFFLLKRWKLNFSGTWTEVAKKYKGFPIHRQIIYFPSKERPFKGPPEVELRNYLRYFNVNSCFSSICHRICFSSVFQEVGNTSPVWRTEPIQHLPVNRARGFIVMGQPATEHENEGWGSGIMYSWCLSLPWQNPFV